MPRPTAIFSVLVLLLLVDSLEAMTAFAQDGQSSGEEGAIESEKKKKPRRTFPIRKKKKKKPAPRWAYEQSYRLLGTATFNDVANESTNPGNTVYQLPKSSYLAEFRPEVSGTFKKEYKFVLRPRAYYQIESREKETPLYEKQSHKSEAFVNEAYFAISPNPAWQIVLGTQNYQWGPAELASPSNPFFRDLGLEKTYFFETRGRAMARVNYSPTAQLSVVIMGEPTDNGADRPEFDRKFHKQVLAKVEYSDESQTNYIGITASGAEADKGQIGAYGNYEIATAFTAYFDLSNRIGSKVYYPVVSSSGAGFLQTLKDDEGYYATAVFGFRYVTERAWDIRIEGFKDQQGWTGKNREDAVTALLANLNERSVKLYLAPGSFFPGQDFIYASLRIPDWGYKDSFTLSLRNFHSLADNTEKLQVTFDTFLSDHLVGSTGITYSLGPENGQLTQGYLWQTYLSGAWIF